VGRELNAGQADAVISVVTALASAYTRGQGFTAGEPNSSDIRAVILSASARLITDTSQITADRAMGPFSVSYRTGFDGWSTAELYVLNRYRERAR
jgi:hypothetical protein